MGTAESLLRDRVAAALAAKPNAMTMQLARDLGVPEADVIRALPDGRAVELDLGRWEELIRSFEALGAVHVIVSNGAVTLEAIGQFGNFSTWGEFFNVQTKLDMHVRWPRLGAAFAVEKPGHLDGVPTLSVQFFDKDGQSAFKVFLTFGGKPPTPERRAQFDTLRQHFRAANS
jgi:putative heme iron utilization protein